MKSKLWQGDCLELMKSIPDGSIDMVMTDPPYGTTSCKWDSIISLEQMWKHLKRIIKPDGAIIMMAIQPFTTTLIASNIQDFKYCWYWEKERLTNIVQVKKRAGKTIEECCVFYHSQPLYIPQMVKYTGPPRTNKIKDGKLGKLVDSRTHKVKEYKDTGWRYPTQVLKFQRDILTSNLHPTQKPLALMEYLIKTYTNEGDTVLDFTMGSGTTGVACWNLFRNFIGIELDKIYFDIAKKRIEGLERAV